ncbi:MAG: hypothetical protein ACTH6Y_13310 [Vibrio hibernica]
MKRVFAACLVLTSLNAFASPDKLKAINLVKKYSSTIACSIIDNSYKATEMNVDGDNYTIVYWEGDVACGGGRGSMTGVLTVVGKGQWGDLFVLPKIEQPDTKLVCIDTMNSENNLLNINGISYGPNDYQSSPNHKMQYSLKLDVYKNKFEVVNKLDNPKINISNKCVGNVR